MFGSVHLSAVPPQLSGSERSDAAFMGTNETDAPVAVSLPSLSILNVRTTGFPRAAASGPGMAVIRRSTHEIGPSPGAEPGRQTGPRRVGAFGANLPSQVPSA